MSKIDFERLEEYLVEFFEENLSSEQIAEILNETQMVMKIGGVPLYTDLLELLRTHLRTNTGWI